MAYINRPALIPMENLGVQVHVNVDVDMVSLVNDAFVIADDIIEEAHNIESQDMVVRRDNGGQTKQGVVLANNNDEGIRLANTNQEVQLTSNQIEHALHKDMDD
jgi:predicted RNA-binding protein with PUA domain